MKTKLKRRQSLAMQLADELRKLIESEAVSLGDKLPSENELIKTYDVSRTVVREALSGLRADGILETRQGVGAFVTRHSSKRLEPFDPKDLQDVLYTIEFRMAFEPEIASLAAERRTKKDLLDLKQKFKKLSATAHDAKAFAKPDFEFHLAIARATHNPFFIQLEEHLGAEIIPHSKLHILAPNIKEDQAFLKVVHSEHTAIHKAIVAGDQTEAFNAMRAHLKHSQDLYSKYL